MLQVRAVQFSLSALPPENQGDSIETMHKNAATFYGPSPGQEGEMEEEVGRTDKTGCKGQ